MPFVHLTYYVWSERLIGSIGDQKFSMRAVSGGGRGGKKPDNTLASYGAYRGKDAATGQRGGTLPPGYYRVEKPSTYGGSIHGPPISKLTPISIDEPFAALNPTSTPDAPYGRDYEKEPFLIHGPGVKGSDGCIVIDWTHRKPLLDEVEAVDAGITLRVTREDPDGILDSPNLTVTA